MTSTPAALLPVLASEPFLSRWWRTIDRWSVASIVLLFGIGLLLGLASSPPLATKNDLDPYYYVEKQAMFGGIGLLVVFLTSMVSPKLVRRLGTVGFLGALLALLMLPLFGTDFGKGAIRWYSLGFASIQPSEFLKPCMVVVTAWLMSGSHEVNGPPGRLLSVFILVLVAFLLALQPDYGQAALVIFAWFGMYFIANAPLTLFVTLIVAAGAAGTFAYSVSDHVARRIDAYLSEEVEARTQMAYAQQAIQDGGTFGVGLGEGQVKWSLPDAHTDFIIAVAAEEYGLVLVFIIISLYALVALRSLYRILSERDPFIRLAAAGLAATFAMQAVINMGVASRLLPAKGMTLPFVSYGGSSMIAAGLGVGMLLALTRTSPDRTSSRDP